MFDYLLYEVIAGIIVVMMLNLALDSYLYHESCKREWKRMGGKR